MSFFGRINKIDNLTESYLITQFVALDHNFIPCSTSGDQLEKGGGQYVSWRKTQVLWSEEPGLQSKFLYLFIYHVTLSRQLDL